MTCTDTPTRTPKPIATTGLDPWTDQVTEMETIASEERNVEVVKVLARNWGAPKSVQKVLASHPLTEVRARLAVMGHLTPTVCETLALDTASHVRSCIAANPVLQDADVLDGLSRDAYWAVRCSVGQNPNTDPDTLDRLSRDADASVRAAVAGNRNANPSTLTALVHRADVWIKDALVNNPRTPSGVIYTLSHDDNQQIAAQAQRHPAYYPQIIQTVPSRTIAYGPGAPASITP